MRALLLSIVMSAACAHGGQAHYVNVASVRQDIKQVIDHDQTQPRAIVSMGHVTDESAVVYTQANDSAPRREESWTRTQDGWRLADAKDITAAK
jgi:hypothetical protein